MGSGLSLSAWRAFWGRGGVWRGLLVAAGYILLYLAVGRLLGALFRGRVNADDVFGDAGSVFFGLTLPLLGGALVLAGFVTSLNWWRPLFAAQPVAGRAWMWVAPVAVGVAIVLRFLGIPYRDYGAAVVALTIATGLMIGFVEELLCRGIVVKLLRGGGQPEWIVMVVSSLIFALLHTTNLLSGMTIATVAATVLFTFGFGICMYLTLRATGNLLWPILLHGLYDPALFLATGGIDTAAETGSQSVFLALAAPANIVYMLIGLAGLILVRGKATATQTAA